MVGWNNAAMVSDLPKLMVSVARRFHYQAMCAKAPSDLPHLKLHNPIDRLAGMRIADKSKSLMPCFCEDAPLADHPHVHEMYARLCEQIFNFEDYLWTKYRRCFV
jgi:hypothetical protein